MQDYNRPNDKLTAATKSDTCNRAKDNIKQLTEMLEHTTNAKDFPSWAEGGTLNLAKFHQEYPGIEFDETTLDTTKFNEIIQENEKMSELLFTVDDDNLTPLERSNIVNSRLSYLSTGEYDKSFLVEHSEYLEYLDDFDVSALDMNTFVDLAKKFDSSEGDFYGLLSSSHQYCDSPTERSHLMNEWLERINEAQNIPGIEHVIGQMGDDAAYTKRQGSEFELGWIAGHIEEIQEVALPGLNPNSRARKGYVVGEGIDVMLKNNTAVELKSYQESSIRSKLSSGEFSRQLTTHITRRGAESCILTFDSRLLPASKMPEDLAHKLNEMVTTLRKKGIDVRWDVY